MTTSTETSSGSVQERLLNAARDCFLADEYHQVTTRAIAEKAGANVAMIRYYFGNKEGLFEAMISHTLEPLLQVLDGQTLDSAAGFGEFLALYYQIMCRHPEFPKLILKILALNQGPGRRFIKQLLERGRIRGTKKIEGLKAKGQFEPTMNPDIVRMAFVSLAMMPMLLKDVFEEQLGQPLDAEFFRQLAEFNGRLFTAGIVEQGEN